MENHTKRIRKARRQGLAAIGRDIGVGPRDRMTSNRTPTNTRKTRVLGGSGEARRNRRRTAAH